MITALVAGERDPAVLADLAQRTLRRKIPDLTMALAGRFDEHHAVLCQLHLDHVEHINTMIGRLDARIEKLTCAVPKLDAPAVSCGFVWLLHDRLMMVRMLYLIMVRVFCWLTLLTRSDAPRPRSCSCYGMKSPCCAVRSVGHDRRGRTGRCCPR
jgi:hypothetical protein